MSTSNVPSSSVTTPAPMNVLAVVGFVVSLLGFNFIAIILGAIGLSQIKHTGQRGRGFALAAIWIGVISLILIVVLVAVATATTLQASTS